MRSVVVAAWAAGVLSSLAAGAENWPAWRGPRATGSSSETGLPATWSESHNVVWKLPVPGVSGSTPIVWEGFVFVNVAQDDELFLWAVDAAAGERLWQRLLHDRNRQERKQDMSSPSPVTDGEHVWALTGTGVLKSFDFAGNERWRFDLQGRFGRFGMYRG
ncbi:MAG: PQQ-binding-like beta-propeller repeat protein, partial [Thermoanaerobaculia bacterium]|nr:PQQ-binding-like beta-propeller repeat protein [Thermoanaerobaculia bacterium]